MNTFVVESSYMSCYVFALESIAFLICSVAMSLHDIISEVFYLSWHCTNLCKYCTVWDSVGVLVMHGAHTTSMLMRATHLRIYVHLKTSPVVQAARSNWEVGSSNLYHWRRCQCKAAHGWMVCVRGVHVLCSTCTVYVHHCRSNGLRNDGAFFYSDVTTYTSPYILLIPWH